MTRNFHQSLPREDAQPPLLLQPGSPIGRSAARQPWSPQDYPSNSHNMDYDADAPSPSSLLREGLRRREPSSESGVDNYDLAAYPNTFQRGHHQENIYPSQSQSSQPTSRSEQFRVRPEDLEYPPSPIISRPFSADDYASVYPPTPSLAYNQNLSSSRRYLSDPKNLPAFLAPLSPTNRLSVAPDSLATARSPVAESMDISQFPAFSRAWYEKPSYPRNNSKQSDTSGLPWDMNDSTTVIDPITRRERIRMLEHEFGKDAEESNDKSRPILGSVDANGNLITAGPKKRATVRWAQALLALLGGASAIYGALFIKPKSPAPPTSTAPAFVLYGVFILSFGLSVYLFVIRRYCCGKRNKANDPLDPAGNGMFVLPVQGFPGQQQKKNKKKGKGGSQSGDVHINLIIDPRMLQQGEREELGIPEDDMTSSHASTSRTQRQRRRNVFEGLALENQWKQARSSLKLLFTLDILSLVVWCAAFVYVLFGKKCPPGQFDGWCTSYNIAIACSCFLCIAFGFSVFFGIVDLHASRISPRTRT